MIWYCYICKSSINTLTLGQGYVCCKSSIKIVNSTPETDLTNECEYWENYELILPEKRNYLEHDQSDISGSMFAKLLQILSEMCEFCVAIWCGVVYCHGPVIWCSLCYPAPAKYLSNRSNLLSHSLGWGGWSLLKHSGDALDNRDNARRLCQEPTSSWWANRLKEIQSHVDFCFGWS